MDGYPESVEHELRDVLDLLVDEPDEIDIEALSTHKDGTVFEVQAAPSDIGKIVGRQGRTVRALRTLLAVRGEVDEQRYELEIVD